MNKFLRKASKFILALFLTYLVINLIMSNVVLGNKTLMELLTGIRAPGMFGHSLQRFREIENKDSLDILFVGSSHCYQSFDPRIFKQYGFGTFNIGSTAQTPLNSYFLLKKYLGKVKPKVIIMELSYLTLSNSNGIESLYDLAVNIPISTEIIEMGIATKSFDAYRLLLSNYLSRIMRPLAAVKQQDSPNINYISNGYVENIGTKNIKREFKNTRVIELDNRLLSYLEKTIEVIKNNGIELIFVTQPLPKELLNTINNYQEISDLLESYCITREVKYHDYNKSGLKLDLNRHFYDRDHLNSEGVKVFNEYLINDLIMKEVLK